MIIDITFARMGAVCINVSDFKIFRYLNQYRSLVTGTFPENQQICATTQIQTTTLPRYNGKKSL